MKRKWIGLFMAAAMVMTAAGCGSSGAGAENTETPTAGDTKEVSSKQAGGGEMKGADGKELTVGSIIMNTSGEWFAEVMQGMKDAGEELGVKVNIVSSDNEVSKESDNIATFIAQGVDAICISPLSADASKAAVESADAAGIPVIGWNGTVNSDVIKGFVGVDAKALGGQTAEYAVDYIKQNFPDGGCKLALLINSNYEVAIARCDGFKEKIQPLVDEGLVTIVNEQPAELQDEGIDVTEQMLTANPEINMIWAWNQTSLLGCMAALQNQGRNDIVVMGTDMSVELAKDMQDTNKKLTAITTQQPYEIGYQAVSDAVKAAKGEEVQKETLIPVITYTQDKTEEIQEYIKERDYLVEK